MYVIDGLFLTENITGIQRTSRELVRELGKLIGEFAEECSGECSVEDDGEIKQQLAQKSVHGLRLTILVPRNYEGPESYENIPIIPYGKFTGRLWEQIDLPRYLREHDCPGLFTENTIPLALSGKSRAEDIVILHDVCLRAMPQYFLNSPRGIISYLWRRIQYRRIAQLTRTGLRVVTVSEFSKSEIQRFYSIDSDRITVIYNAWQHMCPEREQGMCAERESETCQGKKPEIKPETEPEVQSKAKIRAKVRLGQQDYVFSVSSRFPHKNFRWIAQTAELNPDVSFVVAGISGASARGLILESLPGNLILTGYITDEEMQERMRDCAAFLFPSLYEGFGMPPLEAAASGAPRLILSDTPCMREIYGDTAQYIDPTRPQTDFARLLEIPASDHSALLSRYSWAASARKLAELMEMCPEEEAGK